jgi:peroxiredoxin
MRGCTAPEVRGSRCAGYARLAGRIGLLVLLLPAFFSWLGSIAYANSPSESPEPRQLLVVPSTVKPFFTLPDLAGSPLSLQGQAGRVVLVHFFATWCEPCREELGSLNQLVDQQRGFMLSVMAVNVAEVPARVKRFLETAPVQFPVLLDADRAVTKAWGVNSLPTTFILDRSLVPRLWVEGDLDWTSADVMAALAEVHTEKPK